MSVDMSILSLVTQASPVVQAVMALLLMASMVSWTLIVIKWRLLGRAKSESEIFEDKFWSGTDLEKLYEGVSRNTDSRGLESIFSAGFKEYSRQVKSSGKGYFGQLDMITRSMRVALTREVGQLESNLSFLATVGSTSPYIGLFGTVWGIMNSFRALSLTNANTLSAVAPGIAEALVATAIGLFAAIPAVIAYNGFSDDVEGLITRYDNFVEEFLTLLQRNSQRAH
ncbi:MAG TPA: protein TolQ [Gammaproteobacteria bacterium]|nr:protein TolQ [Gammaproteobacteria bacterium]